jgi:MFS transporter, PPP family, 3-phenylpropionic acid transporter
MMVDRFALRLSLFFVGLFVALGIQMPFLPVWLAAKGLDASAIGMVLAAPLLLRIVAVPLVTGIADRTDALRGVLVATAAAATAGYAILGLVSDFWAILIVVAFGSAALSSLFPLGDAYALTGLAGRTHRYGSVRLWGSGAFIVGSLIAGLLADRLPSTELIWPMVVGFVATLVLAVCLQPLHSETKTRAGGGAAMAFLRSPAFVAVAAATSLIQASHAVYYGFSTLDWSAAGLSGHAIGALWAIGVVAEIVLFAVSGRLSAGPGVLLSIGAAGAAVRWSVLAMNPPMLLLPVLQCLHGLSFGATHMGAVQFLARAAPGGLAATAQGYLAIVVGVTMAASMSLSGRLYAAFGTRAYAAMAAAAVAGGLLALVAHRLSKNQTTRP